MVKREKMIDVADISEEKKWLGEKLVEVTIKNFQRRKMNAQYVDNRKEALDVVLKMIPPGAVVARGDSVNLEQIGIIAELIKRNENTILDPFKWDAEGYPVDTLEKRRQIERESFFADIYLTGTNAITLDGKLVNVDGLGNRVAAMIFGPKKVIVVVGVNKIVKDVNEAFERIRQIAAPMNAKRLLVKQHREEFKDIPCVLTGRCLDCTHDFRLCGFWVIIDGNMARDKDRMNVVLIGEDLGI